LAEIAFGNFTAGKKRGFCRLRSLPTFTGNFGGHYSENRRPRRR
jgi:hypothetical protein